MTKHETSTRLAGLDGLRAVAVLAVIAYHFLPETVIGGYVGVDVFFVISGFLITGLLLRERTRTGRIDLPAFWLRRARRLVPALVPVVTVCSAAAYFVGGDVLVRIGSQVLGAATFSSNWLFIAEGASYFDSATPELFRNLWSLAVEEQFYLVWPAAVILLLHVPSRVLRIGIVAALAVASALAMVLLTGPDATRVYFGTDTHSFGLALGAALALLVEGRFLDAAGKPGRVVRLGMPVLGALAVGGIVVLAVSMNSDDPITTRGGLAIAAALTAVAIAGATARGSWLGASLDSAPLRWIGERSYGLYLWHWPVLVLLVAALPTEAPAWVAPALALGVTVAAAAASYRFVELPIRVRGLLGALPRARVLRLASGAAVAGLLTAVALTGAAIASDPGKGEAELAVEAGQEAILAAASQPGFAMGPRKPAPPPPPPSGDQISAVGDSVMLAAAPQLQETFPGISIDATVSRSMYQAEAIVQSMIDSGQLRPILVLGLGTNGWIKEGTLERVKSLIPPETLVVVVNVQAPREWTDDVNSVLEEFARKERNVELANWHDAIRPQIDVLADDQVHPGPTGSRIYCGAIADALQRLAELPPLLDDEDYETLNRPV
jgi:peptidoglycan/LPS O-acetylase OafA/YrhL